ncbi:MAG: sensor domain-containing diguanylate cyclase [Planctomycetes bacterium]|nr:sensor domain-containing diguanylate cyclase [Planctomycetota bacterium]
MAPSKRTLNKPKPASKPPGGEETPSSPLGLSFQDLFQSVFDGTQDVILIVGADDGNIIDANASARRLLGYEPAELAGRPFSSLFPAPPQEKKTPHDEVVFMDSVLEFQQFVAADGTICPMDQTLTEIKWKGVDAFLITLRDARDRNRAQSALMESQMRLKAVLDTVSTGVLVIDKEGLKITQANPEAERIIGLPIKHLLGRSCQDYVCKGHVRNCAGPQKDKPQTGKEYRFQNVLAQNLTVLRKCSCFTMEGKEYIVASFLDISDRKKLEEQLIHEATHDSMTGVFNRRHLFNQMELFVRLAIRYSRPFSACICDIDRFKSINDAYGHDMGDKVLMRFVEIVQNSIRRVDLVGRYGGDEFVIAFPETPSVKAAVCIERIRKQLEDEVFQLEVAGSFRATGSFGLADLEPAHLDANWLIRDADKALYHAKQLRNKVVLSSERHSS